jgi:putative tryptophan/tyrosine transport system substrate-binding protein
MHETYAHDPQATLHRIRGVCSDFESTLAKGFEVNRRDAALGFLTLCAAAPMQGVAQAQSKAKIYRVAVVTSVPAAALPGTRAFELAQLKALGYVEGQNLILDLRSLLGIAAEGQRAEVAELLDLKPDVIVVDGTTAAVLVANATTTIPIVMAASVDPVGAGLTQSLARPSRNVTGLALDVDTGAEEKRLEIFLEMLPKARRIAFVGPPASWEDAWGKAVQGVAAKRGVDLLYVAGQGTTGYAEALETVKREKFDALFVGNAPAAGRLGRTFGEFSAANRIPSACGITEMVDQGCLMTYGQSGIGFWKHGFAYVDKILKGAKPADLPIEQPTEFQLVINLKTAEAIGLKIPQSVLLRADRVVE